MKMPVLVLISLLLHAACNSQYTVTKVIGHVTNKTTGESLYPGSKLRDDDLLAFSSEKDMLRVIVSGKGVYVISPGPKSEKQQNLIVEILKSALKIKSKEGYLSGRSENDELIPAALHTDAEVNMANLMAPVNKYRFDPKMYNTAGGSRFFLQTEVAGSQPLIRSLKTISDTLVINASDFQNGIPGENVIYKLGYYDRDKNSSELLTIINPTQDPNHEMQTIIKLIVSNSKEKDRKELMQACYAEIYESIGKPSYILFTDIYDKTIGGVSKNKN
jgi:hypothetical protein